MSESNISVPKELENMLTTQQAAQRAKCHQRTIVSRIRRGLLPALKLPGGRGQYYVKPEDVDRMLEYLSTPTPYTPENP